METTRSSNGYLSILIRHANERERQRTECERTRQSLLIKHIADLARSNQAANDPTERANILEAHLKEMLDINLCYRNKYSLLLEKQEDELARFRK